MAPGAVILPGASTNPDFDIAQLQDTQERQRKLLQRPGRLQAQRQLVVLRPRVPRPGPSNLEPQGVTGRQFHIDGQPDERGLQPAGDSRRRHDQRVQVRLQRGADARRGATRDARLRRIILISLSGSVANTGIAGQGAVVGPRDPGRPRPREQRGQRPRRRPTIRTR